MGVTGSAPARSLATVPHCADMAMAPVAVTPESPVATTSLVSADTSTADAHPTGTCVHCDLCHLLALTPGTGVATRGAMPRTALAALAERFSSAERLAHFKPPVF
jgi:hypothetical protein